VLLVAELVNVRFEPEHIGLGDALADTADGTTFTVTTDVVAVVVPQALVAATVYIPALAVVTAKATGF
jgi:hypothetical protein